MNPTCQHCGAPDGAQIIRQVNDDGWLKLGRDCFYYGETGGRYRMSEIPDDYVDSPLVKVELNIVLIGSTPRCLCQHCAKQVKKPQKPVADADQMNFFFLVEDVER